MPEPSEPKCSAPEALDADDTAAAGSEDLNFETALSQLEEIVDRLEEGDLELEAALAAFEQGVALSRRCAEQLARAERRIEVLIREGENWQAQPFEADEAAPEEGN
ncbi:MAG TPA: exodeoxyribonuclease VII small subunit [Myxococcota bacterium]